MTPAILTLFNCLTDGLAIIASDGKVRFANEGMRALLPATPGSIFPHATVAAAVEQALEGHLALPHSFDAEIGHDPSISAPDPLRVHVVRSPAGKDLVVVIRNLADSTLYQTTISNLGLLVDRALADPLRALSDALAKLLADMADPAAGPGTIAERRLALMTQANDVAGQLQNLAQLAQLGRTRALEADERIVLEHWLVDVLARHTIKADARRQYLVLERASKPLPTIYGSAHWLGLALDACLDNAIRHSENGTEICLSAIGCGNFVRITLRNKGRGLQSALLRQRLMQPLMRSQYASDTSAALGLGLPLARHIIELHHGRLALDQELDGFVTCTIELPAGASPQSPPDLNLAQALRYADDLVRLIARRDARSGAPTS